MTRAGIQISSVRVHLQTPADVLDSFRKFSRAGCRAVQIQWIAPAVPAEFIRDALTETGLECVGTQDYTAEVLARLDEVIAHNELWGGRYVCLSGIPERCRSHAGCLAFAAELDGLSRRLEQRGLILTFHPRSADVMRCGEKNSLEVILEAARAELQFCSDVYHLARAGLDPAAWLRRAAGRSDLVHFKDACPLPGGGEALMPVGQGSTAWGPVIRACLETGVKFAFAEQETWQTDPFDCLGESLAYMLQRGLEP